MLGKRRPQKERASKAVKAQSISIHSNLSAALPAFLRKENLHDRETGDAVGSLVTLLSNYREEGRRLFPEVFFFNDIANTLQTLPNSEQVVIGTGPKTSATLDVAMKRCAPLAQWGWSIYVMRTRTQFEYGLIRCGLTALSLTAFELLIEEGDESLPAIGIRHISQHEIEVSGACKNRLRIHFGRVRRSDDDPVLIGARFCRSIVTRVPSEVREQVHNFYRRILGGVLKSGHGCLAIVLRSRPGERRLPSKFRDGVVIEPPIDISKKVATLLKGNNCESDVRLRATAALIRGMLSSDGITVFGSDGSVRAYNVFIKNPIRATGNAPGSGGARHRAYASLCSWVGYDIDSAFFLSQDGQAEFLGS
ncbi:MAG TPA: hypothetical protein VGR84_02335 [Candidatus Acidoferrales bacterium]|nr:hypothetical protein [Candidatus Acidoferrales bacterium]